MLFLGIISWKGVSRFSGGGASFFSFKWGSLLDISVQAAQIGHEFLRLVFSVYTKVNVQLT